MSLLPPTWTLQHFFSMFVIPTRVVITLNTLLGLKKEDFSMDFYKWIIFGN